MSVAATATRPGFASAIFTVAAASIKENRRRKLIAFFLIASALLTAGLIFLSVRREDAAQLFGPGFDLVSAVSLGAMRLAGLIATLIISMGALGQPFASGEAALVLTRPISRMQYALGRLLGSSIVIAAFTMILGAETQLVRLVDGGGMSAELWEHWLTQVFNFILLGAITSLLGAILPHAALAAVLGYFVDEVLSIIAFGMAMVGGGAVKGIFATMIKAVWAVSPKYLVSPVQAEQLNSLPIDGGDLPRLLSHNTPLLVLWAAAYLIVIVAIALRVVERKDP